MNGRVTIGIVTKNRRDSLIETLNSVVLQSMKPYELILVENNLHKTLDSVVERYKEHLNIKYILYRKKSIAACRNIVLTHSMGEYIAFIDDDCILSRHWVKNIIRTFNKNNRVVGVVGRSLNFNKGSGVAALEQDLYTAWISQYINPNKVTELKSGMFVNTRNFAIKRYFAQKKYLRFNPRAPHKIEDTDFGIRLYKSLKNGNYRLLYDPKVFLHHKNSTNIFEFLKRHNLTKVGNIWLSEKYPGFSNVKKINENTYEKLSRENIYARILFIIEGFIDRQKQRLIRFIKNGEILIDVEKDKVIKIW